MTARRSPAPGDRATPGGSQAASARKRIARLAALTSRRHLQLASAIAAQERRLTAAEHVAQAITERINELAARCVDVTVAPDLAAGAILEVIPPHQARALAEALAHAAGPIGGDAR